jgi:flagellar motor component MotA
MAIESDDETPRLGPAQAAALAATLAGHTAAAWSVAPGQTLLGFAVATEALAVRYIGERPAERDAVLAVLRALVDQVASATGTRH